jgi:hypothetical protein
MTTDSGDEAKRKDFRMNQVAKLFGISFLVSLSALACGKTSKNSGSDSSAWNHSASSSGAGGLCFEPLNGPPNPGDTTVKGLQGETFVIKETVHSPADYLQDNVISLCTGAIGDAQAYMPRGDKIGSTALHLPIMCNDAFAPPDVPAFKVETRAHLRFITDMNKKLRARGDGDLCAVLVGPALTSP